MKKSSIPMIMIWVLYSLGTGIFLFFIAMAIGSGLGFGMIPGLIAGFVVMLAVGLLVRGIHGAMPRLQPAMEKIRKTGLSSVIVEYIFLIVSLVGMALLRLLFPGEPTADDAFEMAKVSGEGFAPTVSHGGMAIYLRLLHGMMLLLGNKAIAATMLQVLLLICATLGLYFGVRKLSGTVPALMTVVFIGFAPYMLLETKRLTPLLLFLIFYGLGIRCIAALPERMCGTREISGKVLVGVHYLVTGLLIGFCCYLDAAGITLLIYLTWIICLEGARKAEDFHSDILGNGVLVFVCCVLSGLIGYVASHGIFSLGEGSLAVSVSRQLELYLPDRFHIPATAGTGVFLWDVPILAVLMAVGVFSFWYSRKIQDRAMWLFTAGLLILMQCFGMDSANYFSSYALLYLLCVGMAGSSVADLFAAEDKEEKPDIGVLDTDYGEGSDMDFDVGNTGVEQTENDLKFDTLGMEQEPSIVINYIENPLPLPKKREHKVMDYDYEVADDDDFDIQ